jgi:hypothetical protein
MSAMVKSGDTGGHAMGSAQPVHVVWCVTQLCSTDMCVLGTPYPNILFLHSTTGAECGLITTTQLISNSCLKSAG